MTNSLTFPLSENVFILPSFLKVLFPDWNSGLTIRYFQCSKDIIPLSSGHYISDEKFVEFVPLFPYRPFVAFLQLLSRCFSSSFVFSNLIIIFLGMIFFEIICLGITALVQSVNLCPSPKFGKILDIISSIFSPHKYHPLFLILQ